MQSGMNKLVLNKELPHRRVDNVVYQGDKPLLKMIDHKFPDFDPMSVEGLKYTEKYYSMYPDKIEIYDQSLLFEVEIREKKQKNVVIRTPDLFSKVKPGSRKDQVKQLLDEGITSSKQIADILGTNPSYVQRLIKEIQT